MKKVYSEEAKAIMREFRKIVKHGKKNWFNKYVVVHMVEYIDVVLNKGKK